MDHVIDVDELARRIIASSSVWRAHAQFGGLTWRDETSSWPKPIVTERSEVRVPESVGFTLERSSDVLTFVAWTGGWADVSILIDQNVTTPHVEFSSVDEAMAHIARIVDEFLGRGRRSSSE